jgi:putative flippase GtrA
VSRLPTYWKKLFWYSLIGGSTFALDLLIYWYLKTNGIYYLSAAAIAFLFSVTLNYIISRAWLFSESDRHYGTGYLYFITIAITGAIITVAALKFLVEKEGFDPYIGRVFVGIFVGLFNYTANYFLNFSIPKAERRIHPKEPPPETPSIPQKT